MNLREFLGMVRLYWKTFAAVTLAVLAMGAAWMVFVPLQYVSNTQLLVSLNGTTTANAYQNDDVVTNRVNSYLALLTSDAVDQRVVDKLGLKMTPRELAAKISAVQVPKTAIIDIAVSDRSPEQARTIAETVAKEFIDYTAALESPTGEDAQKIQTRVVSDATAPRSRLVERISIGILIAILAALIGAAAVWVRSMLDRVVRVPGQAATAADLPVVGTVDPAVADTATALDPYRRVRTVLARQDGQVIQLSPVDAEVDARQIAINLATTTELAGLRSVVVDATGTDPDQKGLTEGSEGAPDVLAANRWVSDPDQVANPASAALVERLRGTYEQVVIATQPAVSSPLASALTDHTDVVVLVVEPGESTKANVSRVSEDLKGVGGNVVGVLAATP